jgi:hypothetical protein
VQEIVFGGSRLRTRFSRRLNARRQKIFLTGDNAKTEELLQSRTDFSVASIFFGENKSVLIAADFDLFAGAAANTLSVRFNRPARLIRRAR